MTFRAVAVPESDLYALALSVLGLAALVALAEGLRRCGWAPEQTRRLVHAGVGVFVALTPDLFVEATLVYGLAAGFVGINGWALWRRKWPGMHPAGRQSWGTVVFPLALIPALYVCWTLDPGRQFVLRVAFLILAFADPVASWVGTARGTQILLQQGRERTSRAGSLAFGVVAVLVTGAVLLTMQQTGRLAWTVSEVLVVALSVAALTTAAEALGRRGWDNFFIVVAAVGALVVAHEAPGLRWGLAGAVAGGALFTGLTARLGVLDRGGALAGGLLAATLLLAGPAWLVPGVVFFVLSSALSRVGRARKERIQHHYAKSDAARDAAQVYANGGIAWGLLVLDLVAPANALYWGFLGAFATAAADTWATELGVFSRGQPRSLRTGRKVPRGTSGAVSGVGSLAAGLGASTVVGAAALAGGLANAPYWVGPVLIACGWLGALADSLVGAAVQAQYFDPSAQAYRETPGPGGARLARGWPWITNDRVNWMGTGSGALLAIAAYAVLG